MALPPPPPAAAVPSTVPAKCPRCGASFWVAHPALREEVGWAFCPRCGQPTASLPPRATPPMFSWEVYRRFYPEPAWPRSPTAKVRRLLVVLALLSGVALLGIGGSFAYFGSTGLTPPPLGVGGVVWEENASGGLDPAFGVFVEINGLQAGRDNATIAGPQGNFSFSSVPSGEHQIRVIAAGYRISRMEIFVDPEFTAPSGNTTALSVILVPVGPGVPATDIYDQEFAPYPDLETYLSYVFSASAIEFIGAAFALWGAWALWKQHSVVRGVLGASAALLAPVLGAFGGYQTLFLVVEPAALIAGAGAFLAGCLGVLTLLLAQRPLDGVEVPPPAP